MKKKILVVEDEKALLNAISKSLEKSGYDTYSATSHEEGISMLTSLGTVDAIWLDHYLLSRATGLDFLQDVRANKTWKDIPVFVVTNSVSDNKISSYSLLGIEKFFVKAEAKLGDIISDIDAYFKESNE